MDLTCLFDKSDWWCQSCFFLGSGDFDGGVDGWEFLCEVIVMKTTMKVTRVKKDFKKINEREERKNNDG